MKHVSAGLAVLLLVFGVGLSTASAQMYISGNLGAVFLEDSDFDADGLSGEFSFDTGFGATVGLGHEYGNGLRTEIELGYRSNDFDEVEVDGLGSGSVDGDMTALSGMLNVYYDFLPKSIFTPFIGGGVGVANVEADADDIGSEDDNVFAYQAAAGGTFAASEKLNIDLQYRYFATDDPEFDGEELEYTTHNIMLGLRYSF